MLKYEIRMTQNRTTTLNPAGQNKRYRKPNEQPRHNAHMTQNDDKENKQNHNTEN